MMMKMEEKVKKKEKGVLEDYFQCLHLNLRGGMVRKGRRRRKRRRQKGGAAGAAVKVIWPLLVSHTKTQIACGVT